MVRPFSKMGKPSVWLQSGVVFTKVDSTLEPNALLESKVGIWLRRGAGDGENLS